MLLHLQVLKYGVIGMDAFQQDLYSWSHLYVGGRLQKPVVPFPQQHSAAAAAACQHNLWAALNTSLLLSPAACSLKVQSLIGLMSQMYEASAWCY